MQLDYTVSLKHLAERQIDFRIDFTPDMAETYWFELPALQHPLVQVSTPTVEQDGQAPVPLLGEKYWTVPSNGAPLTIRYTLTTPFAVCVGTDREIDLIYPFINEREVFFGSGTLAFPAHSTTAGIPLAVSFRVTDVPEGWMTFGSLITGDAHPAKLDGFFLYACPAVDPYTVTFVGKERRVTLRWLVQPGKTFPAPYGEPIERFLSGVALRWLAWLDDHLAPYSALESIDVLLLHPAPDYAAQTHGRAFATGENVLNGILSYGSDLPHDLAQLGYSDYKAFLTAGVLHELLHFYTTASFSGAYKSVLYPAPGCPPHDRHLIGEALNLYFSETFAAYVQGEVQSPDEPPPSLLAQIKWRAEFGRRDPMVELYLIDGDLRAYGTSLWALFAAMARRKRVERSPYPSSDWMIEVLRDDLGIQDAGVEALLRGELSPAELLQRTTTHLSAHHS